MDKAATSRSPIQAIFAAASKVEPHEIKSVVIAFLYFFFLLGSYYILRPVRDAMGTVYGADRLEDLFTYTFLATFIAAPIYAGMASRVKLSKFLPWVYGFFIINILVFYALFANATDDRTVAAVFYVWVSVFNMFIISVFWSFMADVYSRTQAKRLYGFIAAGGSAGAIAGPALTASLVTIVGNNTLLLISAAGFLVVVFLVMALEKEKQKLMATGEDVQRTTLDRKLSGNPFDGFTLLLKSPYLMLFAAFILLLSWVSTILYFEQADLISKAFESRAQRTQAFAVVDLIVNIGAIVIQLVGTGRLIHRFGVTTGLMLVPVVMIVAFIAIAVSPVLLVLLGVQVVRRIAEYAVAKPSREMLFTVVDQESKYKAKNVLDTVVYRFGDVSAAWVQAGLGAMGLGTAGVAVFGVGVAAAWGWVALKLGRKYEGVAGEKAAGSVSGTAQQHA